MKDIEIFNILRRLAEENDFPTARLASAIVINSRIVSFGTNKMKSHPFQKKYGKNSAAIFSHSEINGIRNALRYVDADDLRKASLYTVRVKHPASYDRSYIYANAKPCIGCMRAIMEFKLRKVFWTNDDGDIEMMVRP